MTNALSEAEIERVTTRFSAMNGFVKGFFALAMTMLAACASTSGVVPIGHDTYMVARSEKGFDTTGSKVKAGALKEANAFCSSKNKTIEVVDASQNDMIPFKSDAQAEIHFKCVLAQ